MLTLVWSSEASVKDEVLSTFTEMFLTKSDPEAKKATRQQPQIVAINLVSLTVGESHVMSCHVMSWSWRVDDGGCDGGGGRGCRDGGAPVCGGGL
jgi:hypothetical protein